MSNSTNVVTRFAPSPTGFMHVGGVRTALYAWLFARKHGGTFILRIEDTDKEREVAGSIEHIIESLTWLGITWDEGVGKGGPHGPYIQSERLANYKKYAEILIEKGLAYPDPYSPEQVDEFRKKAEAEKRSFLYRDHRPEEVEIWDGTKPLRLRVPHIKRYEWHDEVRGDLSAGEEALDDFILIKSDGYPTYNFAHIIDDLEMGVTHIMRGEEFVSSTPKFLSLYDALGIVPPKLATMPVILAPEGHKKLGKRDGAKDILDYRSEGYLPEAMINFLTLLGWHPEDDREVMTVAEILEAFSLERIQKGGAKFDETKLLWMSHQHIQRLSDDAFTEKLTSYADGKAPLPPYTRAIAHLLKERSETLEQALSAVVAGEYNFLEDSISYEPELLLKGAKADASAVATYMAHVINLLQKQSAEHFSAEEVKEVIFPYATEVGRGAVLWPMRTALSGKEKSPDPFTLAGLLGKEKTLQRLTDALAVVK